MDFSREMSGLSLGMERPAGSAHTAMDVSMAQMLVGKSLSAVAEGIRCWMEKEAENQCCGSMTF
jgi:hypothetical protein